MYIYKHIYVYIIMYIMYTYECVCVCVHTHTHTVTPFLDIWTRNKNLSPPKDLKKKKIEIFRDASYTVGKN